MTYGLTQSALFDGVANEASRNTPTAFQTGSGARTIEAWIYLPTLALGGIIQDHGGTVGTTDQAFTVEYASDGVSTFKGQIDYYGNLDTGTVDWGISLNTWFHFAVTYDTGTLVWYKNGSQIDTATASRTPATVNTATSVGDRITNAGNPHTNIRVSLMRYWTVARTQAQISANICNVLGPTANLGAEWTFDNVLTDNSGNGNTLTGATSPSFSANVPSTCTITPSKGSNMLLMGV